jgi:hypothetical protein
VEALGDEGEITLEVLDSEGRTVRTLTSTPEPWEFGPEHPDYPPGFEIEAELSADAGYNRASWDLAWEGAGFLDEEFVDWGHPTEGFTAIPGEYTLRLTVGDRVAETTATVLPDPRSDVPAAELAEQLAFALEIRDALERTIAAGEAVRTLRSRLDARIEALEPAREDDPGAEELAAQAEAILERLDALEARLINPEAEVTYDILAGRGGGAQLYSQLSPLYAFALEGDGAPTQGQREVAAEHLGTLEALEAELAEIVAGPLERLNRRARELDVPYVPAPEID